MVTNTKATSQKVAQLASETLRDPKASAISKTLAASALAQAHTGKQTGANMEHIASKVLQSEKYSDTSKTLAGSLLSQSNKDR
ncbi:hypothetical protein RHM65_12510 [Pseudomonas sp. CCI4.2]|uniref:hypothetical protein n=1 Tax=Pseudomonas sp. CCI4.2 TaxID=3048620 RepID=UPI002AC91FDC|nr:hypothetical protein [Pseudomonas sp. CCI4.2]MEB0091695.1 hypothetical protein [Pseudomonas sp. CCI4.2]WPX56305.1 hypothetical protein RHM65_12510 [Pseudomonas sp. CCI4.2]